METEGVRRSVGQVTRMNEEQPAGEVGQVRSGTSGEESVSAAPEVSDYSLFLPALNGGLRLRSDGSSFLDNSLKLQQLHHNLQELSGTAARNQIIAELSKLGTDIQSALGVLSRYHNHAIELALRGKEFEAAKKEFSSAVANLTEAENTLEEAKDTKISEQAAYDKFLEENPGATEAEKAAARSKLVEAEAAVTRAQQTVTNNNAVVMEKRAQVTKFASEIKELKEKVDVIGSFAAFLMADVKQKWDGMSTEVTRKEISEYSRYIETEESFKQQTKHIYQQEDEYLSRSRVVGTDDGSPLGLQYNARIKQDFANRERFNRDHALRASSIKGPATDDSPVTGLRSGKVSASQGPAQGVRPGEAPISRGPVQGARPGEAATSRDPAQGARPGEISDSRGPERGEEAKKVASSPDSEREVTPEVLSGVLMFAVMDLYGAVDSLKDELANMSRVEDSTMQRSGSNRLHISS